MITIAVMNESADATDTDIKAMLPAFKKQWNNDLASAWDLDEVDFVFVAKGAKPPEGAWWLVWLDSSDQANALAYHDLTDEGLPISKVFVKTILADNASLSVAATHELVEMAVDPTINLAAQDQKGTFWAYETADPVEDDQYGYEIDGVLVTDFLYPGWFGFNGAKGPFDHMRHCSDAFQILSAGYAQQFGAQGWTQITDDSVTKAKALNPSRGSRRERREREKADWRRSGDHAQRTQRRAARAKAAAPARTRNNNSPGVDANP